MCDVVQYQEPAVMPRGSMVECLVFSESINMVMSAGAGARLTYPAMIKREVLVS